MVQQQINLGNGTITFIPESNDLKQQYLIDAFEDFGPLLESFVQVLTFCQVMYESQTETTKKKLGKAPDFDNMLKSTVNASTKFKEYKSHSDSLKENKESNPAKQMTIEELEKKNKKRLEKLEKEEKKSL